MFYLVYTRPNVTRFSFVMNKQKYCFHHHHHQEIKKKKKTENKKSYTKIKNLF